jgi:hypothetical protein
MDNSPVNCREKQVAPISITYGEKDTAIICENRRHLRMFDFRAGQMSATLQVDYI